MTKNYKPGDIIPVEIEIVRELRSVVLGAFVGGAAAVLLVAGMVYWNEYVIPRQAVDDMCEAKFDKQYDFARDLFSRNGIQSEAEYYELQKFELNKCKVQGYARLNGSK